MPANLTDYDHAVLAALHMGLCERYKKNEHNSAAKSFWRLNGQDIMPSLLRLEQVGELYIAPNNDILFPGTAEYRQAGQRVELLKAIRRGIRNGTIKLTPSKGNNPP